MRARVSEEGRGHLDACVHVDEMCVDGGGSEVGGEGRQEGAGARIE